MAETTGARSDPNLAQKLTPYFAEPWFADPFWGPLLGVALLVLGVTLLHLLTQRLILRALDKLFKHTGTWWDNALVNHGVFRRLAWLIPWPLIRADVSMISGLGDGWADA